MCHFFGVVAVCNAIAIAARDRREDGGEVTQEKTPVGLSQEALCFLLRIESL